MEEIRVIPTAYFTSFSQAIPSLTLPEDEKM